MDNSEILSISSEFESAWEEFFGAEMYFVPFIPPTAQEIDVYDEVAELKYDFANKKKFFGQVKDNESLDLESAIGDDKSTDLTITFVTLALPEFNDLGIIQFTDQFAVVHTYKVTDFTRRVMINTYRIFTKAKVVELSDYKTGEIL